MPGQALGDCPVSAWVFGKMPAHGDFVSRGLDDDTVAAGDAVLAEAMALAAHRWDLDWDEVYVETPVWRFIASPGVFGQQWTAGVFLASVDAVGRQFPLVAGYATTTLALLGQPETTTTALDYAEALARDALLEALPVDTALERLDTIALRLFSEGSAVGGQPAAFALRHLARLESTPWQAESVWWVAGADPALELHLEGGLDREGLIQLFRRVTPPAAEPAVEPPEAEPAPPAQSADPAPTEPEIEPETTLPPTPLPDLEPVEVERTLPPTPLPPVTEPVVPEANPDDPEPDPAPPGDKT